MQRVAVLMKIVPAIFSQPKSLFPLLTARGAACGVAGAVAWPAGDHALQSLLVHRQGMGEHRKKYPVVGTSDVAKFMKCLDGQFRTMFFKE